MSETVAWREACVSRTRDRQSASLYQCVRLLFILYFFFRGLAEILDVKTRVNLSGLGVGYDAMPPHVWNFSQEYEKLVWAKRILSFRSDVRGLENDET
jgi:hypothetical protein